MDDSSSDIDVMPESIKGWSVLAPKIDEMVVAMLQGHVSAVKSICEEIKEDPIFARSLFANEAWAHGVLDEATKFCLEKTKNA
jgi:hypothetical protein